MEWTSILITQGLCRIFVSFLKSPSSFSAFLCRLPLQEDPLTLETMKNASGCQHPLETTHGAHHVHMHTGVISPEQSTWLSACSQRGPDLTEATPLLPMLLSAEYCSL